MKIDIGDFSKKHHQTNTSFGDPLIPSNLIAEVKALVEEAKVVIDDGKKLFQDLLDIRDLLKALLGR